MPSRIMNAICRGTVGYISYLASCSSAEVYSEYLLYEPILLIAQSKRFKARNEYPVGLRTAPGDSKRVDFYLQRNEEAIAIEAKWLKSKTINVAKDVAKLQELDSSGFILLFGHTKYIECVVVKSEFYKYLSKGKVVTFNAGSTSYSSLWYKYKRQG